MNLLSVDMLWLVMRVSVVACLALGLAGWTKRRDARTTVLLLGNALALALVLTLVACCPWPDAWRWTVTSASATNPAQNRPLEDEKDASATPGQGGFPLDNAFNWLRRVSDHGNRSPGWNAVGYLLGTLYGVGVLIGVLRLGAGWLGVRSLLRRSKPIVDADLIRLGEALAAEMGCSHRIRFLECPVPGLTATVGWRHPVVFLPADWRDWNAEERRTVLAHEIAHIRHRDYLIGLMTRLCLMVHFYHPMVLLMAKQIRWHQEVAADSLALQKTGGRGAYLKSLARLALRLPARTPAGAVAALPAMTGGTLMRRIDMLCGTQNSRPIGRKTHAMAVGLLAVVATLVATLRGPANPPTATAAAPQIEPYELGYLPADATGFVALRPRTWLQQPAMEKWTRMLDDSIDEGLKEMQKAGLFAGVTWPSELRPANIEQIVAEVKIIQNHEKRLLMLGSSSIFIRVNHEFDWPKFLRTLSPGMKEIHKDGVVIYELAVIPLLGPTPMRAFLPDRRSVVLVGQFQGVDNGVEHAAALSKKAAGARQRTWCSGWSQIQQEPLAAVINDKEYRNALAEKLADYPDFQKTLGEINGISLAVHLGASQRVRLLVDAQSVAAASKAVKTVKRYCGICQEVLADAPLVVRFNSMREILRTLKVQQEGSRLECEGQISLGVSDLIGGHVR